MEGENGYALPVARLAFKRREAGAYLGGSTFFMLDRNPPFPDPGKVGGGGERTVGKVGEWGVCAFPH